LVELTLPSNNQSFGLAAGEGQIPALRGNAFDGPRIQKPARQSSTVVLDGHSPGNTTKQIAWGASLMTGPRVTP